MTNDPDNGEMLDTHGSTGLLDKTLNAGRLKGAQLRLRHQLASTESATDYADLFRTLQIRPDLYQRFLDGILKVVRQKNIKELQRATDASIKQLSSLVLRGYRNIVWKKGSAWLLEDSELEEGEKRLLHGADNERYAFSKLEPQSSSSPRRYLELRDLLLTCVHTGSTHCSSRSGGECATLSLSPNHRTRLPVVGKRTLVQLTGQRTHMK